jgi:NAD(P)-dependent dehydrogenase (short-subunit alcohol dehydrogenase family)
MNIAGKTAIVTGGASGLGAACARMIVAAGGRAICIDLRDGEPADGIAYVRADVSDETAVQAAVESAGPLHIAINCAGIGISQRTINKEGPAPLAPFEKVIRVNLIGTFNVARLAAASMSRNAPESSGERGVIINTASIAAYDGQIGQVAYSASKGGIVGMTLPMARDLSKIGIRVVTIAPGIFDTPLLGALPEEVRAALSASVPFPPRLGRPPEYAALARHIIENEMLNGEVIRLDGSLRMAPK